MALTDSHRNGPESSRLLGAKLSHHVDNQTLQQNHGNCGDSHNEEETGGGGGSGEPTVVIEMVPPHSPARGVDHHHHHHHHHPPNNQEVSPTPTPTSSPNHSPVQNHTPKDEEEAEEGEGEEDSGREGGDSLFDDNCCIRLVERLQEKAHAFVRRWSSVGVTGVKVALLLAYLAYFCYCMSLGLHDEGAYRLLLCTLLGLAVGVKRKFPFSCRRFSLARFTALWGGTRRARRLRLISKVILTLGFLVFMVVFVIVNVAKEDAGNMQSMIGLVGFILLLFLVSKNPAKVNWHTVFWGIGIQWILAVIILRTHWGLVFFEWVGDRVSEFLKFAIAGAEFVFGKDYFRHRLAMLTVSIMLYFNSVIHVLFHLGAIQAVINSFGRFLAFCLDTNPIESFAASSNIFISLTEAPMLLKPFLRHMTRSELHTVMTCGFASISGSALGTYVTFNIQANHLLTASVMSAPAALAISKLMCPETERSRLKEVESDKVGFMSYRNVLEAASSGAVQAISISAGKLANQIAFVSLLAFFNSAVQWLAVRGNFYQVDFKWLCSYLFYPLVFAMGTAASDCRALGSLLGIKLFGTPIMSYTELGVLRSNRLHLEGYLGHHPNATWAWHGEDVLLELTNATLLGGVISVSWQ